MYDYECQECGVQFEALVRMSDPPPPCTDCGGSQVEKVYLPHSAPHVKQDSIPGGMVIENLDPTPRRFDSHSAYQHELRSRGLTNDRFHSKNPRGPYSTKW